MSPTHTVKGAYPTGIEARLQGTRKGEILQEFLTNSAHFPIANIFLELLLEGMPGFLFQPDLYVLALAAVVQGWVAGSWRYAGRNRLLLGNLVGPALYTVIEVGIEGMDFFFSPSHLAYWGFSLAIGLLQQARQSLRGLPADACILAEHVTRTSIFLGMYWIFEGLSEPKYIPLSGFLEDNSHVFVAIVVPLLGIVLGFANITATSYLTLLRGTAAILREYSQWLLGRELLSEAVENPAALTLRRQERTVLFMDIRGFTAWSETRSPEEVVAMLNAYFESAEAVWADVEVIKVQHTADEIMAIFATPAAGARAALALLQVVRGPFGDVGLGAGIGLNTGAVVEGLIGSVNLKGYTVIGDVVNTAKRICDQAVAGEILVSAATLEALGHGVETAGTRQVKVKGKSEPLTVFAVKALPAASAA